VGSRKETGYANSVEPSRDFLGESRKLVPRESDAPVGETWHTIRQSNFFTRRLPLHHQVVNEESADE
jgi:hypothetical protein